MKLTIDKPRRRDAPYQRDIVWSQHKMSMLIDSILNNYYIPPLIFSVRPSAEGNIRYCIDGKQRLSSIWKFMRNEIPFIDESGERDEYLYFDPSGTQDVLEGTTNRKYISDSEKERFNDLEFTMIEYNNLNEDEELEIFSRVQLGMALTFGETLNAFNNEASRLCKEIKVKYDLKKLLGKDARVFHVFATFEKISDDPQGKKVLNNTSPLKKQKLPLIQYIIFGLYIFRHSNLTLKQYITDLQHLRTHFDLNYNANTVMGSPCFQEGIRWMDIIHQEREAEKHQQQQQQQQQLQLQLQQQLNNNNNNYNNNNNNNSITFSTSTSSAFTSRANNNNSSSSSNNILIDSSDDDESQFTEESDDDIATNNNTNKHLGPMTKPSPSLKRLKTAHNNKSVLNRELKILDSPSINPSRVSSSMGQTSRSGQPMARRGGHRK
ncbi:hypothetical protein BJ944DRAFT_232092 [Cunninghamella echinulata]|nr:hypothetical protein BJ944DRAFT_232092 [Cunninghamella echinulata]